MSEPTYEQIEAERRRIVRQAFQDQRASVGSAYIHGEWFHNYVKRIYARGVKDGKAAI